MTQAEESPSGGAVPAPAAQRIASCESPAAAAALRPDPGEYRSARRQWPEPDPERGPGPAEPRNPGPGYEIF